jgi:hypothetical protein
MNGKLIHTMRYWRAALRFSPSCIDLSQSTPRARQLQESQVFID